MQNTVPSLFLSLSKLDNVKICQRSNMAAIFKPAVCYGLLNRLPSTKGLGTKPEKMAEELSSVRAEHKFDETALHEYLKKNLQGFPRGHGTLTVLQYRFVFNLIVSMVSKTSDPSSCIPADQFL